MTVLLNPAPKRKDMQGQYNLVATEKTTTPTDVTQTAKNVAEVLTSGGIGNLTLQQKEAILEKVKDELKGTPQLAGVPYSAEKSKGVLHELHGRVLLIEAKGNDGKPIQVNSINDPSIVRINPPVEHDLLKSAPVAIGNATLVTAIASFAETALKPQFVQTAKPELYAKLSGVAAGAALTTAEYIAARYFENQASPEAYLANSLLVGGAVALGIRLVASFLPQYFSNPALPQQITQNTQTNTTTQAQVGDYLNLPDARRVLPNRQLVTRQPVKQLADYATVPAVKAVKQAVALPSPFAGLAFVQH